MRKLSEASRLDFERLLDATQRLGGFGSLEAAAQAFVDTLYEPFQESLVLLRLFASLPYSALPPRDRALVDKKAADSGTASLYRDGTPILTLLGTRGYRPEWNERSRSEGFRCIPLVSSGYVGSLSMLSMQFKAMKLDLGLLDSWDSTVVASGHADQFTGMLYVKDAGTDQDEQGRMAVPRQQFVAENQVKTALGFGTGYPDHPTIVTLFAFTNETLERTQVEGFAPLLQNYLRISKEILCSGPIFGK